MSGKDQGPDEVKGCCARFYENDLVSAIFGENFHPGGEELTLLLGKEMALDSESKVLDIACGAGTSAVVLAQEFGCHVTGVDLGEMNLKKARERAEEAGLSDLLEFRRSDAESLGFDMCSVDAVICECALCTFPDPETAVREMRRVLKIGGRVGITDMTLTGIDDVPEELKDMVFKVLCIAGALPPQGYADKLKDAGFINILYQDHSYALRNMLERIQKAVRGLRIAERFAEFDIERDFGIRPEEINSLIRKGFEEIEFGTFGYGLFVAERGDDDPCQP